MKDLQRVMKMAEPMRCLGISKAIWDAVIVALMEEGCSLEKGGGFDHS